MPWFWDLVQLSIEISLQLSVSPTLLKQSKQPGVSQTPAVSQPLCLVSMSEQLQRIAAHQRSSTRAIYESK